MQLIDMAQKKYYAVKNGRTPGIYTDWDSCQKEVIGFSGAVFKSFLTLEEAKAFLENKKEEKQTKSEAVAYVDGSFSLDLAMFSFGAVIFTGDKELHFSKAFSDPQLVRHRNVAGEMKGAEFVMQYCLDNNIKSVDIYYDYTGIENWCTGAWKTNNPETKAYADFYKEISERLEVNFVKVKGHSGDEYNDLADKLAKKALGIGE